MANQANGISVVEVNNIKKTLILFVGAVEVRLQYQPRKKQFLEVGRSYIDGRRVNGRIRLTHTQYVLMMSQAHAIARAHGWNQ